MAFLNKRVAWVVAILACGWPVARSWAQVETLGPLETRPPDVDRLQWHVSDIEGTKAYVRTQREKATRDADLKLADSILARLERLSRPKQVRLTLEDVIRRTVANSHAARVQSYAPAINTAAVVEAEAAFDAVFFADLTKNIQNRPVPSELIGSNNDIFVLNGGIRKLLPTGGTASISLSMNRNETDLSFQTLNPAYTTAFVASLNQPLLRGSGVDFNRSVIRIARNDLRSSTYAFKRTLREVLFSVEEAYWRLVQARREVVIRARLLAEFEKTYDYLIHRSDYDIYHIQLAQTKASLETTKADFIRVLNQVRDAEDTLLATMNDPELNLIDEVEIIPMDFPQASAIDIDRVAAGSVALENRSEIAEARLAVETAALRVGQAKNQALPRLDLGFQYTSDGLGQNADLAFEQMRDSDFLEYLVTLSLEIPMGNRARLASLRQARLAHAQAMAAMKDRIEQVLLEVNTAARAIRTAYDRVDPSLESADANESQVASTVARQERKDFAALNQELNARSALANSRSALLDDLVTYNIALIALERAKGTLLQFNNIELIEENE